MPAVPLARAPVKTGPRGTGAVAGDGAGLAGVPESICSIFTRLQAVDPSPGSESPRVTVGWPLRSAVWNFTADK